MHQTQWSAERPLPPPVSLTSQSHHEKPPEVTCTRGGGEPEGDPSAPPAVPRASARVVGRGRRAAVAGVAPRPTPPLRPVGPRGRRRRRRGSKSEGAFSTSFSPLPRHTRFCPSFNVASPGRSSGPTPSRRNFFVDSETSRKTPRQVTAE